MKIKVGDLLRVWNAYDFLQFPRTVGDPIQTAVYNKTELMKWYRPNTGRVICFTSHNSYPVVDKLYNPPRVVKIRVSNLFTDFDSETKVENAQLDCIKLMDFCEKESLGFLNSFSGMKGFHHFIQLVPRVYDYDEELRAKTRAIHNWLKDKLGFRTMDNKCKEPRRLCRIPYSKHVSFNKKEGEYVVHPTYCFPIDSRILRGCPIQEIQKIALAPPLFVPIVKTPKWDLDGIIAHLDIDVEEYSLDKDLIEGERVAPSKDYQDIPRDDFHELIKAVIPRKCVHNDLFSRNPSHAARRMAVTQLKAVGYNYGQVVSLFEEMAYKFEWVDRMFQKRRTYQVWHIYNHQPPYRHDTCQTIKYTHGLCVGEKCEKFRGW